jgi:hypothetical protein
MGLKRGQRALEVSVLQGSSVNLLKAIIAPRVLEVTVLQGSSVNLLKAISAAIIMIIDKI